MSTASRCGIRRSKPVGLVALLLSACAFDVSYVKQVPTTFEAAPADGPAWTLMEDIAVGLGTGFRTGLRKGTHWVRAGRTPEGDVFRTRDQNVVVEASNIYEAQLVMRNGLLVGFYLPVERSFVAVTPPLRLATSGGENP